MKNRKKNKIKRKKNVLFSFFTNRQVSVHSARTLQKIKGENKNKMEKKGNTKLVAGAAKPK